MGTFLGCLGIIAIIVILLVLGLIWGICELFWPIVAILIVFGIFKLAKDDTGDKTNNNMNGGV